MTSTSSGAGGVVARSAGELLASLWRSGEQLPPATTLPSTLPFLFTAASLLFLPLGRAFFACYRTFFFWDLVSLLRGRRGVVPFEALSLPCPLCEELPVVGTPFFAAFASPLGFEPVWPLGRAATSALLAAGFTRAARCAGGGGGKGRLCQLGDLWPCLQLDPLLLGDLWPTSFQPELCHVSMYQLSPGWFQPWDRWSALQLPGDKRPALQESCTQWC